MLNDILSHPIPAVVLLLGLLVFVHELGHYLVGRWAGIGVEIFSIGFGPRIFGFTRGGTDYRISLLPLGGFVKFAGAHPSEEVPEHIRGIAFRDASLGKRAATVLAGPLANFLLAVAVYAGLVWQGIPHPPAMIGEVIPGSPAEAAGIQFGDKFIRIDDREIHMWRDLEQVISASPGKRLTVTVLRNGQEVKVELTPGEVRSVNILGKEVKVGRAGVALGMLPPVVTVTEPASAAAAAGLKTGDRVTKVVVDGIEHPVNSWPGLGVLLAGYARQGTGGPVTLTVEEARPLRQQAQGGELPDSQEPPKVRQVVMAVPPAGLPLTGKDRDVMHALGIFDSQLTVDFGDQGLDRFFQRGDRIVSFNGAALNDVYALNEVLRANTAPTADIGIVRGFEKSIVSVTLVPVDAQRPEGPVTLYTLPVAFMGQPVEPDPVIEQHRNPLMAFVFGIRETWSQTVELTANVVALISGDIPLKALGGPMLIAKVAGDSAKRGLATFLTSMAMISVNLGLLNLFPIPVLDGGQLVMMGAEAIRRRPLREAQVENFQKLGFAMVLALVVLATYNDLSRFWKAMLKSVVGLFQ